MLHTCTNFCGNLPLVPEKIFEGLYWYGGHLGHVTSIILTNLILKFMYLKAYIQNLGKNGPVVYEKSKF